MPSAKDKTTTFEQLVSQFEASITAELQHAFRDGSYYRGEQHRWSRPDEFTAIAGCYEQGSSFFLRYRCGEFQGDEEPEEICVEERIDGEGPLARAYDRFGVDDEGRVVGYMFHMFCMSVAFALALERVRKNPTSLPLPLAKDAELFLSQEVSDFFDNYYGPMDDDDDDDDDEEEDENGRIDEKVASVASTELYRELLKVLWREASTHGFDDIMRSVTKLHRKLEGGGLASDVVFEREGTDFGDVDGFLFTLGDGDEEEIQEYLDAGADPNSISADESMSALTAACGPGNLPIVRLLLDAGANPDPNVAGSPLVEAAKSGYDEIVKMLIDAGADVHHKESDRALAIAAQNGMATTVEILLAAGARADSEFRGKSALALAIEGGHDDVLAILKRG